MANELGGHARDGVRAAEAVVERQAELIDLNLGRRNRLNNLEWKRQRLTLACGPRQCKSRRSADPLGKNFLLCAQASL